jgi:hypothetical protein
MTATRAWSVGLLTTLALLSPADAPPAHGSGHESALESVSVETASEGVAVNLRTSAAPGPYRAQWLDAPTRLLMDLADTRLAWAAGRLAGSGPVKEVRATQVRPGLARVVIETSQKVSYRVQQNPDGLRVLFGSAETSPPSTPAAPAPPPAGPEPATARRSEPSGPRLYGVVLGNRGWVAFIEDPASRRVAPYQVGQSVGSAVIERIEAESVTLRGPQGVERLRLRGEPTRVDARSR